MCASPWPFVFVVEVRTYIKSKCVRMVSFVVHGNDGRLLNFMVAGLGTLIALIIK